MKLKKALILTAICAAAIGCGAYAEETETAAETETTAAADAATEEVSYPLTITHAFGETVLESKPERIVTIGWENQDTALALGVVPVGVSKPTFGLLTENNLHTWTDAAVTELGGEMPVIFDDVDGLDFESIADCDPDVILASYSGITQEDYDTLSQIAPVIAYKGTAWQTTWRDQTIDNAEGMGMKAEGEAKVAEVEALISEKLADYPQLSGISTAFSWVSADDFSTFYIYLPTDPRVAYLEDLGLSLPESVSALDPGDGSFFVTVSRENADQLSDVQMMVLYGGDEDLLAALQADELMSQIPAIANGAVVFVDGSSDLAAASVTPSILSIPYEIDEYLSLFAAAAENIQ